MRSDQKSVENLEGDEGVVKEIFSTFLKLNFYLSRAKWTEKNFINIEFSFLVMACAMNVESCSIIVVFTIAIIYESNGVFGVPSFITTPSELRLTVFKTEEFQLERNKKEERLGARRRYEIFCVLITLSSFTSDL